MQADGEIIASSKTVQRRIPYKVTYRKGNQKQLEFESKLLQVQGCEDCSMKVTANRNGLIVRFGKGKAQYEITASGQIQNQGKNLHLQAQWTEVSTLSLNKVLYGEAPPRDPTPYDRKDTPFIYLLLKKGTPFTYFLLTNGTPFTYLVKNFASLLTTVNALSLKYE